MQGGAHSVNEVVVNTLAVATHTPIGGRSIIRRCHSVLHVHTKIMVPSAAAPRTPRTKLHLIYDKGEPHRKIKELRQVDKLQLHDNMITYVQS